MKLIMNEKKYIESILNNTIKNDTLTDTIRTLAKYYVAENTDKNEIRRNIENYLKERLKEKYKTKKWESYISKTISSILKSKRNYELSEKVFKLNEIDSVFISQNELERIKLIENLNAEKIAFVLLVYGKINKIIGRDGKTGTYCNREFFNDCGLSFSNTNRNLINHLKQLGYVTPSDNHQSSFVEINIADEEIVGGSNEIYIEDFRDFVLLYEKWRGEIIRFCECGKPIKITGKNQRMCLECFNDHRKEYKKEKQREYRKK